MLNSLLWRISRRKLGLSRWLRDQAEVYLDYYNDSTYDFHHNGEEKLIELLRPASPRVIFDVGANVGDWTLMACQAFPAAQVHAFELSARTREKLVANTRTCRCTVAEVALGESSSTIQYKDYGPLSTLNTITDSNYHDHNRPFTLETARLMRGDDYMRQSGIDRVDLLKIDVEGAELQVLKGFAEHLAQQRIGVIQFEYGYANGDARCLLQDFYKLLDGSGYQIGRVWTAGVRFSPFKYSMNNFDSGPNYVAVPSHARDLIRRLQSSA